MGITKDQIWAAADELQRLGHAPTLAAVRDMLGDTGSFSTIAPAMSEWRTLQAKTAGVKTPAPVHTMTSDNGKEFAEHQLVAAALQSDFYFADPYSPWQRGSNENANGLARQYLPRSMEFSTITDDYLRRVEQRLYNRPRKVLGFKTPLEVFNEDLLNTVANQS